jgi:hypothetical protein
VKRRALFAAIGCLALLVLPGCAYQPKGLISDHFGDFHARLPDQDTVFVCSSYGCRTQTPFKFTGADIAEVTSRMSPTATTSPKAEREAVKIALAWMERRVGEAVGTSKDRPGDDMAGNGDPTQMDCVDVATNLSSYLLILERHKLFRHHSVGSVFAKEDLRRGISGWLHYAAILVENKTGQRYAVDGWLLASGKPPEIVETEKWYIDDSEIVFGNKNGVTPTSGTQRN